MNKSDILKITGSYGLAPNKKFGQNFLINDSVIQKITDSCSPDGLSVLEIGPGLGSISLPLAQRAKSYTAIEIDSGFVRYLTDMFSERKDEIHAGINIIHNDFLKADVAGDFDVIVSNLPYYCASEILFRIAENYSAEKVYVMMQKEMADRITAAPGEPEYGALTVTLSYYFNTEILFNIAGESFYPKPDVKSSFLKMTRKGRYFTQPQDENTFHTVVKSIFWGRRKTLLRSLTGSPHLELERVAAQRIIESCGIDPGIRGETLPLEGFIKLTEGVIRDTR